MKQEPHRPAGAFDRIKRRDQTAMPPPFVYAVLPRCATFNTLSGLDSLTTALSHELVEAVTDPFIRSRRAYQSRARRRCFRRRAVGDARSVDLQVSLPGVPKACGSALPSRCAYPSARLRIDGAQEYARVGDESGKLTFRLPRLLREGLLGNPLVTGVIAVPIGAFADRTFPPRACQSMGRAVPVHDDAELAVEGHEW